MSNENKLTPQYRFPEFRNDGNWCKTELGTIAEFYKGKGLAKNDIVTTGNNYCIHYGELFTKYSEVIELPESKTNLDEGFRSKKNDVLMPTSDVTPNGLAKASCINMDDVLLGNDILIIRTKKSFFLGEFLSRQIRYLEKDVLKFVTGSTVYHLYASGISKLKINYPKQLAEQQKIAACLSSLDNVITGHEEKLTALEEHKKGLMQTLFPKEGSTKPKYRFPEFENDEDWVETNVGMNCKVKGRIGYRGYTTDDLVNPNEGAIVIGGKHIQNNRIELSDPTFLSWEKYYESPEIMVEMNDIIFSQRGTLGDCAIIDYEIGKATINPSMVLLKEITCNKKFLYYTLISDIIQNEVKKFKTLAAIPMLSQKQINGFKFYTPKPKEQQKIASILSSVDNLIVEQREKIDALKEHKKGLMQGLFPKNES